MQIRFLIFLLTFFLFNNCLSQTHILTLDKNWYFKNIKDSIYSEATVPGCVHTDLLNNNLIPDPFYRDNEKKLLWIENEDWEYLTKFIITEDILTYDKIYLNFEGLDTYTKIFLNDSLIQETNNMFIGWDVECKKQLVSGENILKIIFYSPIKKTLPQYYSLPYKLPAGNDQSDIQVSIFSRKAPYHFGWDWGPRFVTSGIWRSIKLVAYNQAKFNSIQIIQNVLNDSIARLNFNCEINSEIDTTAFVEIKEKHSDIISVSKNIRINKGISTYNFELPIPNPTLWWSNGLGKPHLYDFEINLLIDEKLIDTKTIKYGLRNLKVINEKDSIGESFYVELNGKKVFMKGANYIPSDNFLNRVDTAKYKEIVKSAKDANMNMLRIWGGGIYENDYFYDLCDENGILIFQDFMYACSMYPGDSEFLNNVKNEAEYNIKRIRNHPSLALWCGNNEINEAWHNWGWQNSFKYSKQDSAKIWNDYKKIFQEILPDAVNKFDSGRFYWESSPKFGWGNKLSRTNGDMHYWGVWHGEDDFEKFNQNIGRFMSEYGFQSFPEFSSVKKYTLPQDWHIRSEVMKIHQRHPRGNQLIETYLKRDFNTPKYFDDMLYVGQLLQAEGIKTAIEAHRRNMSYCMGTLYWQLNDCWPVASWSGIDYYGNWKALHYFVKKLYQNVIINPVLQNDELNIYIVSDSLNNFKANLIITLLNFSGDTLWSSSNPINVLANSSKIYYSNKLKEIIKNCDKNNILLLTKLYSEEQEISKNVFYFSKPKDLKLLKAEPIINSKLTDDGLELELSSNVLIKNLFLSLDLFDGHFSDNYFDLLPNEKLKIYLTTKYSVFNLIDFVQIKSLNNIKIFNDQ